MRLDKFLKVSRLIKRRTVAKEVSDAGKISLNGRQAKASADVKVGDRLVLSFANRSFTGGGNGSGRPGKRDVSGYS